MPDAKIDSEGIPYFYRPGIGGWGTQDGETWVEPEQVEVTAYEEFCFCPEPDLDENDVCRICGTDWKEKK